MSDETPPAAPRTPRDPAVTIRRILAAAREEFGANGFDGTRMEHIAKRAQVSKQLVYFYFSSKDELYTELAREISHETYARLLAIDFSAGPPEDAIQAYIDGIYDLFLENPTIGVVTLDQSLHEGAHIRVAADVRRMQQELSEKLGNVLKRGQADGTFGDHFDANALEFMTTIIVSGCVSSSGMFERYTARSAGQGVMFWREHAAKFILRAIRA